MQGREQVIEGFRLSPQQKKIWQLQQAGQTYIAQCAILIEGKLDSKALEESLKKIVQKHEILRTGLDWFSGLDAPIQFIIESPPLPYREEDLTDKQPGEMEVAIDNLLREESRPFDLRRSPLARFRLSRLSEAKYVLLISLHALSADSLTLKNLFKEVSRFYSAEIAGNELSYETAQYLQFSEWQNELIEEEKEEIESRFQEIGHPVRNLVVPLESDSVGADWLSESSCRQFIPGSAEMVIGSRMRERIESISNAHGSSVSGFLLACWQVLLWRLCAANEIVTECLFDGRQFAELHDALGLFARYLPSRGIFGRELRFDEAVDRAIRSLQQAYDSQESFLWKMAQEKAANQSNAISFEYEEWPEAERVGSVRFTYWRQYCCIDRFKLKLAGFRKTDCLTIEIQYDTSIFSRESIDLIMERYSRLVESAVSNEQALIGNLEIIGQRELEKLLVEWNRTEIDAPGDRFIHELIAEQAKVRPESIAVIYQEDQLSFLELEIRANQLANHLRSLGVGPDTVVGLYLERSVEMMIGLLGILKAGGAYLPLEVGHPIDRLLVMIESAGARVVVTKQTVAESLPAGRIEIVILDKESGLTANVNRVAPEVELSSENLAYVIYTSGSTGKPKGVMIKHGSVLNLLEGLKRAIYDGEGDGLSLSLNAPLTFDASVKQVIQLGRGCRLCIVPEEVRLDPERLLEYINRHGIEALDCTPSQLRVLLEAGVGTGKDPRIMLVGGEAIDARSWDEMAKSRAVKYYNVYGPTECTVDATSCRVNESKEPAIGRPTSNSRIYILDEEGRVAPTGMIGEIYIGGAGLARGYMGEAGITAEGFVPDTFGSRKGERLYRTGDLGRHLLDGRIVYEGRKDSQVKLRGYRIELGEIEEVLRCYPGVREAVVILREDEPGQKRLVAYLVGEQKGSKDLSREISKEQELTRFVKDRLPEYMVPATVVVIEELPLTRNGKIDRRALPRPEEIKKEAEIEEGDYCNAYEEIIGGIWKEVLKIDRVGPGDNFFEIGGHSLLATQVISRVRNAFGVEIGVRSLFEAVTVEGLALRIEEAIGAGEKKAPPIVKASREGKLPLSFAQQRLWFLDQLVPNNPLYNNPHHVRLEGRLDLEALERSINEIIRRHEVLRTRIEVEEGEPTQVIDKWKAQRLEVVDLTVLPQEEREQEARRIAAEDGVSGFNLRRGPMIRIKVLKLGEEDHAVLFTMHHIVSDGWSMGILNNEIATLYRAYSAGEPSPLEDLHIQYADFAVWQRGWLKGEVLEVEIEYWRKRLQGMEALELPTDYPRPAAPTYRGARQQFVVGRDLAEKLRELGRREGVTLFMMMLGGFDVLMSRYTGQADIVLGTDIANRNRAEIEGLIGFFVNQLVMRVEVRAFENFSELLKQVREVCLGAYAHQDVPFEKLVEELQPERDLSRSPLFQAKLVLQNASVGEQEVEETGLIKGGGESGVSKFDLTVAITDERNHLIGEAEYSLDLFEAGMIERMMSHYLNVLKEIVNNSKRPISELSLLSDQERNQIVVDWNLTERPYPEDRCIHEQFRELVERIPDQIALVYEQQMVSYGELNIRANQLAHYLQRLGVGPDMVVGLCLERSVQMVVGLMGVLKAGGAYLPLDPESPLERLNYILEDAGVGVVLVEQKLERRLPAFWGQTVLIDAAWERISMESEGEPKAGVAVENLAYVIYTSGSTGAPKGVAVEHHGVINLTRWHTHVFGLSPQSRISQFFSYNFDGAVGETFMALLNGAELVISTPEALEPQRLMEFLNRERINVAVFVPSLLKQLDPELIEYPERLTIVSVGERCPADMATEWSKRCKFINAYGPTEYTVYSHLWKAKQDDVKKLGRVPIGYPIDNTKSYILDERLSPVPPGVAGEIYLTGAGIARGYFNQPQLTAEKFIPNHLISVDKDSNSRNPHYRKLYRTGDLGCYLSDGSIHYLGRIDYQVKVRGFRIELGEIEAALNEHRLVMQSVVIASDDEGAGKRLIGYVVGEGIIATELIRHVRERLPEYMAPGAIVILEEMPVTASGKIDRKKLPSLKDVGRGAEQVYSGARTPVEEILLGIFEDVLKLDRVGRSDNFFDIGGHSLLATQVVSRIRNVFGVEIGVGNVFEAPKAEDLARKIEEAINAGEKVATPPLVRVPREGRESVRLPLSFAQQRLWFLDQLVPDNPIYNSAGAVRLEEKLDLEVLERSVNEIVRRHEILRTRIEMEEGEAVQVIDKWEYRKLVVEDLTSLVSDMREEEMSRIAREESMTGFNLRRGPMIRVKLLKLGEEDYVVLITMHHIVCDGWSIGVFVREVCELYEAMSEGKESPLPELQIQYSDYAYWQRKYLTGSVLERHLAYWKQQLGGNLPMLKLPSTHPHSSVQSYRGAVKSLTIPPELSRSLREMSRREGVTLFMVLLAAFKTLLYRYTGQDDIIVGTAIANRNRAEIEPLIGFFINMLPIRTDLSENPRFSELLARVKNVALGAFTYQDMPFEKLVEEIQPERASRQAPLFNITFGVQNTPRQDQKLRGVRIRSVDMEQEKARFDLTLWVTENAECLQAHWTYRKDLFEEEAILRMHGHFESLLFNIVNRPDARLTTLIASSRAESRLNRKEQSNREESDVIKLLSVKRKGIDFSAENV